MSESDSSAQTCSSGAIYRVGIPFLILGLVVGALGGALLPELMSSTPGPAKTNATAGSGASTPEIPSGEQQAPSLQAILEAADRERITPEEYMLRNGIDPSTVEGYEPPSED